MAGDTEAEDRTEEPTQRKLDEAIGRGDVARSSEIATFAALGALALALSLTAGGAGRAAVTGLTGFLANAHLVPDSGAGLLGAGRHALLVWAQILGLPLAILCGAALAGGLLQHRPLWTVEPLMPKPERLSPAAGLKRILGREAAVQFAKGLAKIAIVGVLSGWILWREHDRLESFAAMPAGALAGALLALALKLVVAVLVFQALVGAADALYQRVSWMKRQRMSKQEMKQEHKEQEGNPEIKAKIRALRGQRVRKRMMAAVPTATVVVTNPTHFAVALRWDSGMGAPVCVAKGVDAVAARIRAVAADSNVPVIENPPLARALHAGVETDDEIPVEHYKAVAEVIGFVLRLKRRAS